MGEVVHPAYGEAWERGGALSRELREEDLGTHRGFFSLNDIRAELQVTKYRFFTLGLGAGVSGVCAVWLLAQAFYSPPHKPEVAIVPRIEDPQESVAPAKLEAEMELMKRIVSGLVDTVQGLSREKGLRVVSAEQSEMFPYPVRVTTAKAHLRRGPDRASVSLLEVGRDTTLMAFGGNDKWLKVNTPKGEDAWISRSVVAEQVG